MALSTYVGRTISTSNEGEPIGMRKEFSNTIQRIATGDEQIIFLTGDLGFMALENVRDAIGKRFVNMGVAEQNMISIAAALATEGLIPVCYSIAPFIVFRPAEQIRIDVCLHNLNVKLVGNGGGYGYGIMGATHHALEDIAVLSSFQNMKCFIPFCNEDVENNINAMFLYKGPSYLRLGYGVKSVNIRIPSFQPIRNILKGNAITIIAMGPVALNAITAVIDNALSADVFVISELPLDNINEELKQSIKKTGKLLIIEEHVQRGGVGEHLAQKLLSLQITCSFKHLFAIGYPDGLYGSQSYHQQQCGLDAESIVLTIKSMLNE
jgi:transketolase